MSDPNSRDLQRFIEAQARDYPTALAELRAGLKQSHWIWYVFPQLRGLGMSRMSQFYGIADLNEAAAYLAHPLLAARLHECIAALCGHRHQSAVSILGEIDALKLRSCLTLFELVPTASPVFRAAAEQFFGASRCEKTRRLLGVGSP